MARIFRLLMLVQAAIVVSACVNSSVNDKGRPAWIDNPGNGVAKSAGMHVGGRGAQEELAILRGRTEFAKRKGVKIQSEQTSASVVVNDRSSTVGTQLTHEDTKHADIKAVLKEKWRDPESDELWVWLVPTDQ